MSSNDPLSDPLSSTAIETPTEDQEAQTSNPWNSKQSDLFAQPFQSSLRSDKPHQSEPASDSREAEEETNEEREGDQVEEEVVSHSRSGSTSLSAEAPTFVPSFSTPVAADSTSPRSAVEPIPIPSPSPPPSETDSPSGTFKDSTPQASGSSPFSRRGNEAADFTSKISPEEEEVLTTEEPNQTSNQHSRETTSSSTLSLPPRPLSRASSTGSTYSPSILRNLITQSCQSGDLPRLRSLFSQPSSPENDLFSLSNSINPTTGLAPIHQAAKRGHVEVVKWLIEEAGALVGLEDGDGETALHKASLKGHAEVVEYLIGRGAEVDGADADGWTALHNAASTGSLPLISLLLSHGASLSPLSSHGYTPLMNASSKGHLPSVHLLLKRGADPLARNKFGETAFDLAAGVFEVRICEVLGSYEKIAWSARREKGRREGKELEEYSVCGLHSTVPVVLHENSRLVTPTLSKFSTLSGMLGGEEKWTAKAISRNDRRAAFTLPTSMLEGIVGEEDGEGEERACFKSEVGLPVVGKESKLIVPERREVRSGGRVKTQESNNTTIKKKGKTTATKSSASSSLSTVLSSSSTEPSPTSSIAVTSQGTPAWVWLSNWTVDLSSPFSSPQDGWSYSQSFTTPNDEWLSSLPLEGTGNARKWIRRRRWVRVMRRRVDLANWGYLDSPTQAMIEGDYRSRAKFLIDQNGEDEGQDLGSSTGSFDGTRTRKSLARLERAADELRSGMEEDEDQERKRAAQSDLEVVLGKIALLKSQLGEEREENENDEDSDEEFVYSGRDAGADGEDTRSVFTTTRPSSVRSASISRADPSSEFFSTTPTLASFAQHHQDLTQNPDFRVPTNESASLYTSHNSTSVHHAPHRTAWEPDEVADECRRCGNAFSFFKRKHHCRRCGLVCCANCTTHKDAIDPYLVVREPGIPPTLEDLQPWSLSTPLLYRTCDSCHAALALPQGLSHLSSSLLSPQSFFPPSPSLGSITPSETNESEASELTECPVCGQTLNDFGERSIQEDHVRNCLEKGGGSIASGRYLVFTLPPGPLVEEECRICYSEFEVNDRMARLVCLCTFHETCIKAWLSRGHSCPVHAVTDN